MLGELKMPDFSTEGAHDFWRNYDDPMIYRVVAFMEAVERWTVDGDPKVEAALEKMGDALEGVTKFELLKEDNYLQVGCHLKMARLLRILQAIDTAYPGSASRLLMSSEDKSRQGDKPADLFLRRNIVFERLRLLARIFSQERLSLVTRALEGEDEI